MVTVDYFAAMYTEAATVGVFLRSPAHYIPGRGTVTRRPKAPLQDHCILFISIPI